MSAVPARHAHVTIPAVAWLVLALCIGAFARFWDLTGSSLFIDEGWVFHIAEHAPKEILTLVATTDFHPPLFYLTAHYLAGWLHWPPWDYRYLTSAFSLLGIAATWAIARRSFGDTAAAIAALCLAIEPALIQFDRLYRMYAILVALTAVSWWLVLLAGEARGRSRWVWWVLYGLSAVALPYVQYVGGLVVASQGLYAAMRWRKAWPALVCGAIAAAALYPWMWAIRVQYPHGGLVTTLHSTDFSWTALVRASIVYGVPIGWLLHPAFDIVVTVVVLGVLAGAAFVARGTIVPYWLSPIAVHVVASLVTGKDLVVPRYLYVYVPAFCILLGAIAARLAATRYRVGAVALVGAYACVAVIGVYDMIFVPFYQFPDWYQVNTVLLFHERRDDLIVLDQGAEYWVVHGFSGFAGHQMDAPAIPSDVDVSIRWLNGYPRRRVWYIENQPDFTDAQRRIERSLAARRPLLLRWVQPRAFTEDVVRVELFGPATRGKPAKRVVTTTSP